MPSKPAPSARPKRTSRTTAPQTDANPADAGSADATRVANAPVDAATHQPGERLTTAQGLRVDDTDHSLRVGGGRGPTLLEDHHLREKITHFDHERIPERIVHARGSAAHGYFEAYAPLTK